MGTATRKLGEGAKKQGWLVRNEQGETFGPVDFETLRAWACDGRLAPTNEVSEDGADWQLATVCGHLEMNWVAEVTPGTFYGPIHRRAMEELVRDGSIGGACAFFTRQKLDGKTAAGPDEAQAGRIRELTEQYAQAQQQLAAADGQLREAGRVAAEREEQVREARRQVAEAEGLAQAARRQADGLEAQVRQSHIQAEQARQQAEAGDKQLRAQLADQEAQTQRRVAAYEEQVRLAQQQASAYAEQVEQLRQQAAEAETRLQETARQMSLQGEQSRVMQQQWLSKAEGLSAELESLRKANLEVVSRAAEQSAKHAAERAARDARERALEGERQALSAALSQARGEAEAQSARLARLEAERQGAELAGAEHDELDVRFRTVSAELAGVRQALACERDAAQQAEARCAALETALQSAQAHAGEKAVLSDGVSAELRQMRSQIEALCALFRQEREAREAPVRKDERPPVERVYVEAETVEVLPPESKGAAKGASPADAGRAEPESFRRPPDPPKSAQTGRVAAGLSMAELEQQARRELERLGSQGANLFKRKK